jgi:hypothetical protein
VAIVDDLHQVATLLGGKSGHGPIVDYEQLYPGELGEQPGGLAVDAGEGEPGKGVRKTGKIVRVSSVTTSENSN